MSTIALIQLVSGASVEANLEQVQYWMQQACSQFSCDLVVLPENFACMGSQETDKCQVAEDFGEGPIQEFLMRLSKKWGVWIVAGTLPIKTNNPNKIRAACLVYDEQGICKARYDKMHLFDVQVTNDAVYRESATIEPGDSPVVVETPIGCIGLSVCYDLRFPQLYRHLVQQGAELFTIPAAFTASTGHAHWEVLLRARAIENLAYVLAPNQGGTHPSKRQTYGHSMLVDPWGRVIQQLQEGPSVCVHTIDLNEVRRIRQEFPCNEHHRFGVSYDR